MLNTIKRIREKVNIFVYDHGKEVLQRARVIVVFASILALGLIIWNTGYDLPDKQQDLIILLIKIIFGIFVANFFLRLFLSLHRWLFIKSNILETILVTFVSADGISSALLGFPILTNFFNFIGIDNFRYYYLLALQGFIMIFAVMEIIKVLGNTLFVKLKPSTVFLLSFAFLISLGTVLLMMPKMSTSGEGLNLMSALFTSVSASCVTGLSVIDVSSVLSGRGHFILLILMQLGGIGIITFAIFFTMFLTKGIGITHQANLGELVSSENVSSTKRILTRIILYTIGIELVGTFVIFSLWNPDPTFIVNESFDTKVFYSVFHSVSAFCNAGFSLFPDGLMDPFIMQEPILQLAFAVLIILGSIGFPVLRDLFSRPALRKRMKQQWVDWEAGTKIAIYTTLGLIVFGTVAFFLLEDTNTLEGKSEFEKIIFSIFQSVTTRTAGFNTVDIGALATPTVLVFLLLMFIGGSSGSTAGGIKTSTFAVISLSVWATIRGKKRVEYGKRSITFEKLTQAFSIFAFAISFIFIFSLLLSITDPQFAILDLIFEEVSAFATVGLSRGVTADLSEAGKTLIIISMFIGRIGTLTLAFALSKKAEKNTYQYPETKFMVG